MKSYISVKSKPPRPRKSVDLDFSASKRTRDGSGFTRDCNEFQLFFQTLTCLRFLFYGFGAIFTTVEFVFSV